MFPLVLRLHSCMHACSRTILNGMELAELYNYILKGLSTFRATAIGSMPAFYWNKNTFDVKT